MSGMFRLTCVADACKGKATDHRQRLLLDIASCISHHIVTNNRCYFIFSQSTQEKEKEDVEKRNPPLHLPRLDFSSQLDVLDVTYVKESTPPVWELVHQFTLRLFLSISAPKSWNLPETPLVITRNRVSFRDILHWRSRTTRNLIVCWVVSPLHPVVYYRIFMLYYFLRKAQRPKFSLSQ